MTARWGEQEPRPDRDVRADQLLPGDTFRVPRAAYLLLVLEADDRVQVVGRDCVDLRVRQVGPPGDPSDGDERRLPLPLGTVVTLVHLLGST